MRMSIPILIVLSWCMHASGFALAAGCTIHGPSQLMPSDLKRVYLGMSKADLEAVLGQADYAPAVGVYYYSTGGDCPLDNDHRSSSCGVVADFSKPDSTEPELTDVLQSCSWGAVGE